MYFFIWFIYNILKTYKKKIQKTSTVSALGAFENQFSVNNFFLFVTTNICSFFVKKVVTTLFSSKFNIKI